MLLLAPGAEPAQQFFDRVHPEPGCFPGVGVVLDDSGRGCFCVVHQQARQDP
jgi:hypothetical protein